MKIKKLLTSLLIVLACACPSFAKFSLLGFTSVGWNTNNWPHVPISTLYATDLIYYLTTNVYFNGINIGGTTGTNGFMIWNGVKYYNPDEFGGGTLSNVVVDGVTNPTVTTLEFRTTPGSIVTITPSNTAGKTVLHFSNTPVSGSGITNVMINSVLGSVLNNVSIFTLVPSDIGLNTNIYWTKEDIVTNAVPRIDSVGTAQIQSGAVETDEIANQAVISTKLSTNLFRTDLRIIGPTNVQVYGLLGKLLPSLTTNDGKVLGLDGNSNWVFSTAGAGDMQKSDFAITNPSGGFVDKAISAKSTTNATGILGIPASTNGREDETVLTFDSGTMSYLHRSLGSLGGGDMLKSTYATNPLTPNNVDMANNSHFSVTSRWTTNALGLLGYPLTNFGRTDESVVTYDDNTKTYLHRSLSDLGGGDMLKATYATDPIESNKVNQIASNSVGSAQIVNNSITSNDIANGTINSTKVDNSILTTGTSFTGGDMDGDYNSLTLQSITYSGVQHLIKFGATTTDYILAFDAAGNITTRLFSVDSNFAAYTNYIRRANRLPVTLTISAVSNVDLTLSNSYCRLIATDTNAGVTNVTVELPPTGEGATWKFDLYYATNVPFSWGVQLLATANNTNFLSTPPPVGYTCYIIEVPAGSTNVNAVR